jgi:mono/diheme cytochrome c family protein
LAAGCTRDQWQRFPGPDDVIALFPWFSNMYTGPAIQPYKMPLAPVEGTVPITGVQPDLQITPATIAAIDRLENPVLQTAESIERGRDRYEIYCQVCHGDEGAGDGPVADALAGIVPSILTDRAMAYSDGYMYTLINRGRAVMPHYGDKIRGDDRWHVVNYVRVLQGAAR